jgi:tRNA-specific 2-thiouridylase
MSAEMHIAIAMSGGVDSSVAAAMLAEEYPHVFGMMMRLWSPGSDDHNLCCSPSDVANAERVANHLGIPFHVVDARKIFRERVVDYFIDGYAKGITPNPCLTCNRVIRWGFLFENARSMGATHLATGHYARIQQSNGHAALLRGRDLSKDQSYVLSLLKQDQLTHTLLPLGDCTKAEVRQIARNLGLHIAERADSQDLCFIPGGDYRDFLKSQQVPLPIRGPILDPDGRVLGEHTGLSDYTIGQRRGIGIASTQPLYVIRKDLPNNTLVVGPKTALGRISFIAGPLNWIAGKPPSPELHLMVQVRYKAKEVDAHIHALENGAYQVDLDQPLPDITPGQAAVFYNGSICLGGGIIQP